MLAAHQTIILVGETGSGKTTQIPQARACAGGKARGIAAKLRAWRPFCLLPHLSLPPASPLLSALQFTVEAGYCSGRKARLERGRE